MNTPKDFRYQSSWEEFKKATDYFMECLQSKKAYLLYGCIKNIYIKMPNENITLNKIIMREVSPLLEEALDGSHDIHSLNDFLNEQYTEGEIEKEDISTILNLVDKKYAYIINNFLNSNSVRRYYFKENTLNSKFFGIQADINKYIISNEEELKYALIRIESNEILPNFSFSGEITKLIDDKRKKVEFVCDANDLEYIIEQLEAIRKNLTN